MSQRKELSPQPPILRQPPTHLPDDVVLNILSRLPVKSVLRFRCVHKSWNSSITNSNFISTHLNNNSNSNSNNNENDNDDDRAYLIHMPAMYSTSNNPVCMVACDRKFNRISEYPIPSELHLNCPEIVGSCNGLVCLAQYGNGSTVAEVIYVWNPSIRKFKRLPDTCLSQYDSVATGFAYQCENNDYKVVKISSLRAPNRPEDEVEAEVYTLSLNSWRRVGISLRPNVVVSNIKYYSSATFFNKALHWLGYISEGDGQFLNQNMILSFDVNNDKFGEIALPRGQVLPQGLVAVPQSLMVFKGKLAFITFGYPVIYHGFMLTHTPCFVWVMGEYGVHESWNKLFSVQFENVIHVHFYGCTEHGELLVEKELKTESDDGELQRCNDSVIVSFDPETLHEKDLGIQHLPLIATSFMESLVLLDGEA